MPGTLDKGALDGRYTFLGPEQSSTPVTDDSDLTLGTGATVFAFYTLPTTSALYLITGMSWKNGATVSGGVRPSLYIVDANPPTINGITLLAAGGSIVQSGASSVQRSSLIGNGVIVPGGTIVGLGISTNSASATFRIQSGASSQNQQKGTSLVGNVVDGTAWSASTNRVYAILHYKAVL